MALSRGSVLVKRITIILAALVALALPLSAIATSAPLTAMDTASNIYAAPQFYSDYEHLNVHLVVGWDNSCVENKYGFFTNPGCDDMKDNNAEYDVRVYQTYPRWKFVHSERDNAFNGRSS